MSIGCGVMILKLSSGDVILSKKLFENSRKTTGNNHFTFFIFHSKFYFNKTVFVVRVIK